MDQNLLTVPLLTENIKRRYVTAKAGEEVKLISDRGNVQIVENLDGIRFSVKREYLTDMNVGDIPEVEEIPVMPEITTPPVVYQGRRKPKPRSIVTNSKTLFD